MQEWRWSFRLGCHWLKGENFILSASEKGVQSMMALWKKCQFIFIQNVNDYLHLHVKTCIWASASLPWKVHWVILLLTYVFSLSIINSNTWSTDSCSAALETVYTAYDSALISPENKKIDCESILCELPYKRAGLSHVVMVCQVMSFKVATCKSLFCCWLQSMCIT